MLQKGFTLIELMIVIAIVAMLAAMAIPNFIALKEKAAVNAAYASIQDLNKAIGAYKTMNDAGYLPQNFTDLKNSIGKRGEELFFFDIDEMKADLRKLSYGANKGRYTIAALSLDNNNTAIWTTDRKAIGGMVKDCSDSVLLQNLVCPAGILIGPSNDVF